MIGIQLSIIISYEEGSSGGLVVYFIGGVANNPYRMDQGGGTPGGEYINVQHVMYSVIFFFLCLVTSYRYSHSS